MLETKWGVIDWWQLCRLELATHDPDERRWAAVPAVFGCVHKKYARAGEFKSAQEPRTTTSP